MASVSPLVSTVWLRERLLEGVRAAGLRIVDGSWHMSGRNALEEHNERRIDRAVFIDIDELSDRNNELPHMLPSDKQFSRHVGNLGISHDSHVIIYDNDEKVGMFSAARLWWMFKVFGHKKVSILDGGLPRWLANGFPVTDGATTTTTTKPVTYQIKDRVDIVRSMKDVEKAIRDGDVQVVDARGKDRYNGVTPEPRPGLCSGHVIGSINLPFTNLFDKNSKTFASKDVIEQEFSKAGVDVNKPIIATCGSGVTACWISFAISLLGKEPPPVYDGSWTEYVQYGPQDTLKLGVSSNISA